MPSSKKKLTKPPRRKLASYCIACGGMLDPDTYICVSCTPPKKVPKGATSTDPPLTTDAMTAVLKAAYDAGLVEGRKTAQQFVYRSCDATCPCRIGAPVTPPCPFPIRYPDSFPPYRSPFYNGYTFRPGTYTEPQ